MRVKQIADMVGGELEGPADTIVTGAAPIEQATAADVSFVAESKYVAAAKKSKAGCIIADRGIPAIDGVTMIRVDHPRLAFARVLEAFMPPDGTGPGVDETAVVGEGVALGDHVSIGPQAVIGDGVSIGDRVVIGAGTVIGSRCRIGDDTVIKANVTVGDDTVMGRSVIVHPGCVIGADGFGYVTLPDRHHKVPHIGVVIVEDDVEIGANTTIDRGTCGRTIIGQGTKIDNLVMIGHNVEIGQRCLIVAQTGISDSVRIGDDVTFAGQSGSVGHVELGDGTVVAARGVVTRDWPAGSYVSGFPARPHRDHMKVVAATQRLPEMAQTVVALKKHIADLEERIAVLEEEAAVDD